MSRFRPVILLALVSGCLSLPGQRPLPVEVIDAETKQPIKSAGVQLAYSVPPSWGTQGSAGTTRDDGIARLWLASGDAPAVTVEVAAMGYMSEDRPLSAETVKSLESPHLFESTDRRPAAVVVELYAEPRPTVELVLPAGFRGRIRAAVQPQESIAITPGQRLFAYEVPPSGIVDVVGPPIIRRVFAPDFRLRYGDGTPLTQNAKDSSVGYWWLKNEGDVQVFLVGTKADFDDAVRAGEATPLAVQRSGGGVGKGGGRRGGGRHGGGAAGGM
jgi:hypothetical protein